MGHGPLDVPDRLWRDRISQELGEPWCPESAIAARIQALGRHSDGGHAAGPVICGTHSCLGGSVHLGTYYACRKSPRRLGRCNRCNVLTAKWGSELAAELP